MAMRKTFPLLAIIALCAVAPAPAAAAKNPPRCALKGSKALLANKDARVYQRSSDNLVFACLYKKNRRAKLGSATSCDTGSGAADYRLAGNYVAWVRSECGLDDTLSYIAVTDMTTGKVVQAAQAATPAGSDGTGPNSAISDLVVNDKGSVAWIGSYEGHGPTAPAPDDRRQVRKLEPGSPEGGTLVDSGPDIVEGSLGLTRTGAGFYYRKGATPKFAALG
jgi:hypothetical protein